jgi:hypothetical protein
MEPGEPAGAATAPYRHDIDIAPGLSGQSTDSHPADALAVYRTTIGSLKVRTGDDNYRRIASLLLSARACHLAMGTPDEFTRYVAALRAEQKRKRNLMKILNQNGL